MNAGKVIIIPLTPPQHPFESLAAMCETVCEDENKEH